MLLSRLWYYLSSIPTLLLGVQNWAALLCVFAPGHARTPFLIRLRRDRLGFYVRGLMDIWIVKETCLDRDYERASVEIEDGWTVIDIGAGLGDFSVEAAHGRPSSAVYAYEPFPEAFALLERNLELNSVSNVRAFPLAVGGADGRLALNTSLRDAVRFSTAQVASTLDSQVIEVPCTTLDHIFSELGLAVCDFMKIDCEGGEYQILFNTSAGALARVRHLCLEYHDQVTEFSHTDLVGFLSDRGFAVRLHPNPAHSEIGLLYACNVTTPTEPYSVHS
ncbi:MAG: FkbM family methyltransferase [Chloroflexi bacterium]|nr:FkbM family methyltransferase [Chloroflexota bacterium]